MISPAATSTGALTETLREDGIWVERGGKRLLSFSCNDYLNFTQHPADQTGRHCRR